MRRDALTLPPPSSFHFHLPLLPTSLLSSPRSSFPHSLHSTPPSPSHTLPSSLLSPPLSLTPLSSLPVPLPLPNPHHTPPPPSPLPSLSPPLPPRVLPPILLPFSTCLKSINTGLIPLRGRVAQALGAVNILYLRSAVPGSQRGGLHTATCLCLREVASV